MIIRKRVMLMTRSVTMVDYHVICFPTSSLVLPDCQSLPVEAQPASVSHSEPLTDTTTCNESAAQVANYHKSLRLWLLLPLFLELCFSYLSYSDHYLKYSHCHLSIKPSIVIGSILVDI